MGCDRQEEKRVFSYQSGIMSQPVEGEEGAGFNFAPSLCKYSKRMGAILWDIA